MTREEILDKIKECENEMENIEDDLEYILNELNELEDNEQVETAAYEDFYSDYSSYDYEWESLRQEKEMYEKMLEKAK